VAGRNIGPWINAMAIMATLASGGSILGVMGLAYSRGIPTTLALFAGAVVGFPLASILVARPLRRFGRFTITDFLNTRFPHPFIRLGVPLLIVASFTIYIVAQMKAAGITAQVLLGMEYKTAIIISTLIFVLYVSFGGMLAITWTDVVQGTVMVLVVLGCAVLLLSRVGPPQEIFLSAMKVAPELGRKGEHSLLTDLGAFSIWAAAIPVIPHVVMRVYTARDARSARLSLNLAMVLYSLMILVSVLIIVPFGKLQFPELADSDQIFLKIMETQFSPLLRGLAVAAVIAAVMCTTDALLLACSSAIAHDLITEGLGIKLSERGAARLNVVVVWALGLLAMSLAFDPPALITLLYSAAIGVLSAGLFVPVIAGLWWRRANTLGGVLAFLLGVTSYLIIQLGSWAPPLSAILFALPASLFGMWLGARLGPPDPPARLQKIAELHTAEDLA